MLGGIGQAQVFQGPAGQGEEHAHPQQGLSRHRPARHFCQLLRGQGDAESGAETEQHHQSPRLAQKSAEHPTESQTSGHWPGPVTHPGYHGQQRPHCSAKSGAAEVADEDHQEGGENSGEAQTEDC